MNFDITHLSQTLACYSCILKSDIFDNYFCMLVTVWRFIIVAGTFIPNLLIIPPLAEWWVYWNTLVRPSVRPSLNLVYVTSHLSCWILFIFGILVGHDLSMRILYLFHGWLIFARVVALFMFLWPYVRPHILCTQLVICLLSHFYSYLVSWLAMIWACAYYTDFTDGWFLREL